MTHRELLAAGLILGSLVAPVAGAAPDAPLIDAAQAVAVDGDTQDGRLRDLSGIACRPATGERRLCVVVDDEGRSAQVAVLDGARLTLGRRIELVSAASADRILGAAPTRTGCPPAKDPFENMDGEGVAYDAPYFYVLGSHGCTRNSDRFMPAAFVVARFRLDDSGQLVGADGRPGEDAGSANSAVEATFRLSDALNAANMVRPSFGRALREQGLNLEGVAVAGGVLYAGARAPSIGGEAFIVGARVADLFAPGRRAVPMHVDEIAVPLGPDTGVRDLAPLPDGTFLILAGPALADPRTPFSLFVGGRAADGHAFARQIARLKDVFVADESGEPKRIKAEAVLVLDSETGELRVLVMFDGAENGAPAIYRAAPPRD